MCVLVLISVKKRLLGQKRSRRDVFRRAVGDRVMVVFVDFRVVPSCGMIEGVRECIVSWYLGFCEGYFMSFFLSAIRNIVLRNL